LWKTEGAPVGSVIGEVGLLLGSLLVGVTGVEVGVLGFVVGLLVITVVTYPTKQLLTSIHKRSSDYNQRSKNKRKAERDKIKKNER
jgi:Flp pilus assembly pilin Flp